MKDDKSSLHSQPASFLYFLNSSPPSFFNFSASQVPKLHNPHNRNDSHSAKQSLNTTTESSTMLLLVSLLVALCLNNASAALLPREAPCSFSMNAVGTSSSTIVEDAIGENRIGGVYPQGNYYISGGSLFDSLNHNCILDSTTSQFHCTAGVSGATRFSLADNSNLLHDGDANWLACPASGPGDDGSFNIFSDAKTSTTGCEAITLRTGGFNCTALGRPSSSSSASVATLAASSTSSTSTPATPTAACPTDISSGVFQFPHLIVPTSPQSPDYAFGNQFDATISPINTTLFNFDIPSSAPYTGTCALLFLFPYGEDIYFSGIEEEEGENGGLDFALLTEIATNDTTYDTTGTVAVDYGSVLVLPGNNYTVVTFDCQAAGHTVTYSVSSRGNVELDYFQLDAPNPIGLYIVPCAFT